MFSLFLIFEFDSIVVEIKVSHLFSAAEEYFDSTNVETYKTQRLFEDKTYTLVMDRSYDSNDIFQFIS